MNRQSYKNSGLCQSPPVRRLTQKETNEMLNLWHYLGGIKFIKYSYGHDEGCCVFTDCRSRFYRKTENIKIIELARMVGKEGHLWAMSSLMSKCVKEIKKLGYNLIVTYADPMAGHNGTTYLAAGWKFDGIQPPAGNAIFYIDGKLISPKGLYNRHGTSAVNKIKEIYGNRVVCTKRFPKKRFIKEL